jgi:hypothetical protein
MCKFSRYLEKALRRNPHDADGAEILGNEEKPRARL